VNKTSETIDFRTAYDTMNRQLLITAIKEHGISDGLVRLMKAAMARQPVVVRVQADLSDPLKVMN